MALDAREVPPLFDPVFVELCLEQRLPRPLLFRGDWYVDDRWPLRAARPGGRQRHQPQLSIHHEDPSAAGGHLVWVPTVRQLLAALAEIGYSHVELRGLPRAVLCSAHNPRTGRRFEDLGDSFEAAAMRVLLAAGEGRLPDLTESSEIDAAHVSLCLKARLTRERFQMGDQYVDVRWPLRPLPGRRHRPARSLHRPLLVGGPDDPQGSGGSIVWVPSLAQELELLSAAGFTSVEFRRLPGGIYAVARNGADGREEGDLGTCFESAALKAYLCALGLNEPEPVLEGSDLELGA